jgi:hypothetical protein
MASCRILKVGRVHAFRWDTQPSAEEWSELVDGIRAMRAGLTERPVLLTFIGPDADAPDAQVRDLMIADVATVFAGVECAIWIIQGDRLAQDARTATLAQMVTSTKVPTRVVIRETYASILERPVPDLDVAWTDVDAALREAGWIAPL